MSEMKNFDKTMVSRAMIIKLQDEESPDQIKARHVIGYDDTEPIFPKGMKKGYRPDIVTFKDGVINLYEIELTNRKYVTKWRIFSDYAVSNNGSLFIIVPDYLKDEIKGELQDKAIPSRLIYFET